MRVELVRSKRLRQPRIGARELHHLLVDALTSEGLKAGRDALFGILRQSHLLVPPKRAYHTTTNSHHRFHRRPNLPNAGNAQAQPIAAEQVRVADITYAPTHSGFVYLSLITDA